MGFPLVQKSVTFSDVEGVTAVTGQ